MLILDFLFDVYLCFFSVNHNVDLLVQHVSTESAVKADKVNQFIVAKCDFEYEAERFTIVFTSDVYFKPKLVKVSFRKQTLAQMTFPPPALLAKRFQSTISFSKIPIDFFGFGTDRTFSVLLETYSFNGTIFTSAFEITLPVIKQTEVFFKPPGTRYPNEVTRSICRQGFKMNEDNSRAEIQQVIRLEEFKLLSKVERYEVFGYVTMLGMFLDVENSFELDLIQKFNLSHQKVIKVNAKAFKIEVSIKRKSCLVPSHLPTLF